MEDTEKIFDPNLRIIDAIPTVRSALLYFGGMGCFGVVMGYLVYLAFLWLAETLGEKFGWLNQISSFLMILFSLLLFWAVVLVMQDNIRNIRFSRQLRQHGVWTKGTVVGREKIEQAEEDLYYVYYQIRSDFVVRSLDETNNRSFYKLPMGSEVRVCYLTDNPKVSSLVV